VYIILAGIAAMAMRAFFPRHSVVLLAIRLAWMIWDAWSKEKGEFRTVAVE
jgi:hypothetical protein